MKNVSKKAGECITRRIDKEKTTHLIEYAKKYNATINDVILAAIFRALSKIGEWDAKAALRIGITIASILNAVPIRSADWVYLPTT